MYFEKVLKYFISRKTNNVKLTHKLKGLSKEAAKLSYAPDYRIDWKLLSSITPNVRYKPEQIDIKYAIESWRVAFNIMPQI